MIASQVGAKRAIIGLLVLGHGIVLALVVGLGVVVVFSIQRLSAITEDLYIHPFAVSNASVEAGASIALIRDRMLELALSETPGELASVAAETQSLDASIRANLVTIKSYFLGDLQKVDEIKHWLDDWGRLRSSVFELVTHARRAQAIDAVRTIGAELFSRIHGNMDYVIGFARNRPKPFPRKPGERPGSASPRP